MDLSWEVGLQKNLNELLLNVTLLTRTDKRVYTHTKVNIYLKLVTYSTSVVPSALKAMESDVAPSPHPALTDRLQTLIVAARKILVLFDWP